MAPWRKGRTSGGTGDYRARRFLLRWLAAIAVSMIAAGTVEYIIAVNQLERLVLNENIEGYRADLTGLKDVLASDMSPAARQEAITQELEQVAATYGTRYVSLHDDQGRQLAYVGERPEAIEPSKVQAAASSGTSSATSERDEDEAQEEGRYEFLLPIQSPNGTFVVEVDQRGDAITDLVANLRLRKLLGLAVGLTVALPLSYLLGGHALQRQQRLAQDAADTDALTGLAGRRPFRPTLQNALADPAGGGVALAILDIDDFKQVNDRLGHTYGDRVLKSLADSFVALRASDTAFRLGGDEFAVVLTGGGEGQAIEVVERVRHALSARAPGITFSCGIAAVSAADPVDLQELWERADAALYEAKDRGRRQTVSFRDMSASLTASTEKLDAVSGLLSDDGCLSVAFQPIWDLSTGRILGHEALLRLPADSPIDGPQEAFELAHRLGVTAELDRRARHAALKQVHARDWQGLLFLNVHPDALPSLDVDALVAEIIVAGLAPTDVFLEVTEHDGLDRPEPIRVLKRAHALGFRLALDDMGAGNAGLRALTHVRFDVLKLDRHVIARLGIDPAADAAVAAATTFVQHTGGWLIAEGIEDTDILAAVRGGPHRPPAKAPMIAGQGYLLGRPAPAPTKIETRLDLLTPQETQTPTR